MNDNVDQPVHCRESLGAGRLWSAICETLETKLWILYSAGLTETVILEYK